MRDRALTSVIHPSSRSSMSGDCACRRTPDAVIPFGTNDTSFSTWPIAPVGARLRRARAARRNLAPQQTPNSKKPRSRVTKPPGEPHPRAHTSILNFHSESFETNPPALCVSVPPWQSAACDGRLTASDAREEPRPTNAKPVRQAPARVRTRPQSPQSRAAIPHRTPAKLSLQPCAHPTAPRPSAPQVSTKVVVREHFP